MKSILLNPGPVNVSDRVREAAFRRGDACHREPEVAESLARARSLLLDLFDPGRSFHAVFFTGSGTAAVEAALIASIRPDRKLLVVANGVYGDRMASIAKANGIAVTRFETAWGELPDLERLDRAAADPLIDAVALVHHETTTGLLNPVEGVGAIARRHGKLYLLDTVSGLGGEALDLDAAGVSLAASTANKCLGGLPGVSFVLVRKESLLRLREIPPRSLYLGLLENLEAQRGSSGAFTPAVQILWALEEAVAELEEEGVSARQQRFRRMSEILRDGIAKLGFPRLLRSELASNTITAFELPAGCSYELLHDALKARGFIIYAGQGPLANRIFRVATMGQVSESDYRRFLIALGEVVA